ncbi:hypothetical protein FIBSPDRAFT_925510 [Athelia psychrophila]|uniref:Zn(2)-C6 fungal-type domain-containing protein n=1 Tax=Athelia psychrophila TaxID=1759441 RepID=A0A166UFM3_9AGAM|nr:hypothetical protein FIBSPDRAFT_925510 [Fibularhizoctonia sp. CBS 109695]
MSQIDSELGGRKSGGLACAECRRSKIKCDRIFPCQSCVRRDCGNICPDGTLAPSKGNRPLAAQFQRLGNQVMAAQARVEELQDRLRATSAGGSHPLLQEDTPTEADDDLHLYNDDSDLAEAMGSLAVDLDGNTKYRGESASSESVGVIKSEVRFSSNAYSKSNFKQDENTADAPDLGLISRHLGPAIADLSKAFPMGLTICRYTISEFYPFMPGHSRALELVDIYYKKGTLRVIASFNPIERCDLMKTIIGPLYGRSQVASLATIHAHRLSVFFAVLASAAYHERSSYSDTLAQQYHVLSRAALSLETIVRVANTASIQALLVSIWFMRTSNHQSDQERCLLMGTQGQHQLYFRRRSKSKTPCAFLGVIRNGIDVALTQRQSLRMGLPHNLSIGHTGCRFPIDNERHITFLGVSEPGWESSLPPVAPVHDWKRRFSATCISIAVQFYSSPKPPPYEDLLKLDKRLRHSPIPHHLQCPVKQSDTNSSWSLDPTTAYQQYGVIGLRELAILSIHRSYFAQALREEHLDLFKNKLAPSVLAAYKSATQIVSAHPQVAYDQWWLWTSLFSACAIHVLINI